MEVLVASGMFAVLAALAVPQYTAIAQQMRTSAASTQILADLHYAREMAQRTGVPHYVEVTGGTGVNYRIKRSAVPPAIQPATDPVARSSPLGSRLKDVNFSLNGATADPYGTAVTAATPTAPLVFNARGLPSAPASYFVTSADGRTAHVVSITGAGRVRLWTMGAGGWR